MRATGTRLPGDGGHEPLTGISLTPSVALAAIASLGFDAVLGPEGPLIALGSAVGMVAVGIWKVTGPGASVLSTAGAFSAVSALFGGPIVAGALLLEAEVGLGAALIPALLPGAVAAAVGYVIIVGVGGWAGVPVAGLSIPDRQPDPTTRIIDLVLGVVAGLVVALLVRVIPGSRPTTARRTTAGRDPRRTARWRTRRRSIGPRGPGARRGQLRSARQRAVGAAVAAHPDQRVARLRDPAREGVRLRGLPRVGFRGGPVFPAILIGVAVTMIVRQVADMSPTAALAIGTACGMAAFTRLIFSSLVFVLLVSGTPGLGAIPAAVHAAATARVVGRMLDERLPLPQTAPARVG